MLGGVVEEGEEVVADLDEVGDEGGGVEVGLVRGEHAGVGGGGDCFGF